jgi:hypothetical protein
MFILSLSKDVLWLDASGAAAAEDGFVVAAEAVKEGFGARRVGDDELPAGEGKTRQLMTQTVVFDANDGVFVLRRGF